MKELLGDVVLKNRHTDSYDKAQVYRELDQKNFDDIEQHWKPTLERLRAQVQTPEEAAHLKIQDWHWEWAEKAKLASGRMDEETFAVECGATQGLMLVNLTKFGRLDIQKGRELAYIELLSTAPWNRHRTVASPLYKGVGRILVATAISLSIESGFHGRLGLHSLPQSESWYRDVAGFTDMGLDNFKKMRYFEITQDQAERFLEMKEQI